MATACLAAMSLTACTTGGSPNANDGGVLADTEGSVDAGGDSKSVDGGQLSCTGAYDINANGSVGTLDIPGVGPMSGCFAATLTFSGRPSELVSGTCKGGTITFDRTMSSQVYSGSYSDQGMTGTFTYAGGTYSWRATPAASAPAPTIDSTIALQSVGDMPGRRAALIQNAFGSTTLPTAQSTITANVQNPFPAFTNISRVDQYVATMPNGQINTSNLYVAGPTSLNRMVILDPGHQGTCDWTAFPPTYRMEIVLQALLDAGFSVLAMNMPACGSSAAHDQLFASYGDTAMRYFIEPIVQALNYLDAHEAYLSYDMAGLSGGGWTTTIASALDPRIELSFAVAGSMPGVHLVPGATNSPNNGDAEQNNLDYYALAGYLDDYVLASHGPNRRHVQILNFNDDCCYGNPEWTTTAFDFQSYYGVDWSTYLKNYSAALACLQTQVADMNYSLVVDKVATSHQISPYAQSLMLSILSR